VVVVSAMGDSTDDLIDLAHQITSHPDERRWIFSSPPVRSSPALFWPCRKISRQKAISLSGGQAGIQTDGIHSRASIRAITPHRIKSELEAGKIVVVAGFQA